MPCLLPTDLISSRLALTGFHELGLTRVIQKQAIRGGLMIDVGANQGYFSLLWVANNLDNRCISVEASPRNLKVLRGTVAAHGFEEATQIVEAAAGATRGRMTFDLGPVEQSGWGGLSIGQAFGETIEVAVLPIDDLVATDKIVDVLKIDVEGADTWVLEGATGLLKSKRIRNVFFEQHTERMALLNISPETAPRLLRDAGYQIKTMSRSTDGLAEFWATPL